MLRQHCFSVVCQTEGVKLIISRISLKPFQELKINQSGFYFTIFNRMPSILKILCSMKCIFHWRITVSLVNIRLRKLASLPLFIMPVYPRFTSVNLVFPLLSRLENNSIFINVFIIKLASTPLEASLDTWGKKGRGTLHFYLSFKKKRTRNNFGRIFFCIGEFSYGGKGISPKII